MNVRDSLADVACGDWVGINQLRLMPTDPYQQSEATANVRLVAHGSFAVIAYSWADGDKPQDGVLFIGDAQEPGEVVAVWGDSWHQKPQWMECRGTVGESGVIRVEGTYGNGAEQAGWRITIEPSNGTFRIAMDNIITGSHYQVVEATYVRSA